MLFAADYAAMPVGWSDGYVYNNGVRIHYYHAVPAAGKPVVVMAHGLTDIGLCWTTLALKMQKDFDIYMLDARGHGLSDPFTAQDNGETMIKDVVNFVKLMKFEKPILVGHSMGAATVMIIGAQYPELARAIIMLDPSIPNTGSNNRNTATRASGTPGAPGTERTSGTPNAPGASTTPTAQRTPRPQVASTQPKTNEISISMFGDPETLVKQNNYNFEDLVELCKKQSPKWDIIDARYWALSKKQYHGPYSQEALSVIIGSMNTGNSLSKITVPSLILKADGSQEIRKANETAVKDIKVVKLIHIDGAGHNLHRDDLERSYKEISNFLSANLSSAVGANNDLIIKRDVVYREGNSKSWVLDMTLPADYKAKKNPALVIVHGGGWGAGSKNVDVYQKMMTDYAKKGYVTVNVEYRLTGEAPFPACIEDVKCAVRWLRAHAKEYNIDQNRIGAYGHSAGAHLALMLAMVSDTARLEGDGGWIEFSSRVNVVAAGSPPTELGRGTPMSKKEWWPIGYIAGNHPPMLLIQGTADNIVRPKLTDDFVNKMKSAGANIEYLVVEGAGHGTAYNERIEITDPAMDAFFAKYLK